MKATRIRAIGYRRVSDISQVKNHSLDNQTDQLTKAAAMRDWDIQIREETGGAGSGKNTSDRAVLLATLDELDRGEWDALIVTRLDRLSRNTMDGLKILQRAQQHGWSVVVLDLNVDTSTPIGKAMVTVLWAFATYERDMILERTAAGRQRAREAGKHLGYRGNVPDDVVLRIAGARAEGRKLVDIAAELNTEGVPAASGGRWSTGTVSRVARSVTAERLTRLAWGPAA